MKRFLLVPAFLLMLANAATAATVEKRAAQAARTPIAVETGIGHTIDFSQTEERVYRALIGDGGQRLQVLGGSPLEQGTQIINLRRFVPQGNSGFEPVNQTVVTLITQDKQGDTSVYEFSVSYGASGDSLTRIVDTPLSESLATSPDASRTALTVEAVRAGLSAFELEADSPVTAKVTQWARLVAAGSGHRRAAQSVEIDWEVLERLNQVGLRTALVAESSEL